MDPYQISVVVKAAERILSESPIWKTALGFLSGLGGAILG